MRHGFFFIMEELNGKSSRDILNRALDVASQNGGWDFITNFLSPGYQQEKEFGQQVALQMEAQDFAVDYSRRMREMRKAGINPFTAAEGLAGASTSPATPSVPSSAVGEGAASIGQAAGAIGSIAGAGASVAEAANTQRLSEPNKQNILADTFLKYKQAGYTELEAQALAIANTFLPTEKFLGIVAMNQNIDNLRQEYQVMRQGIVESNKRIQEIDKKLEVATATISLMEKQALQAEKSALLAEQQTIELEWFNKKRAELNIDPKSPLENQLFMMGVTGNPNYDNGLGILYDTQFNIARGDYNADPFNEEYRKLYDYRNELMDRLSECREILAEARQKLDSGELSKSDYDDTYNKVRSQMKSLHQQIDDADDNWHDLDYTQGHREMWQDLLNGLLPFGLGAVTSSFGRIGKGPKPRTIVKGYRKY